MSRKRSAIKVLEATSYWAGYVSGWVLLAIVGLTLVEVVSRYIQRHPLILADELGGYTYLLISCLGMAYCWQNKGHIRVDFVVSRLRPAVSSRLRLFTIALALVWISMVCWFSWQFVVLQFLRHDVGMSWLRFPLWIPQSAIPIGFTLLALQLVVALVRAIGDLRSGRNIEPSSEAKEIDTAI